MQEQQSVTGSERFFAENDIIVSKTDLKGRLTYCNKVFLDIAGYTERDCIGQPHSMIRHPDMPRCVFKLLWDTIQAGNEIFAYVLNRAANGDHYWVYAHVTPSIGEGGTIVGYHSNRRVPDRSILDSTITPLYRELLAKEREHRNGKEALAASSGMVSDLLAQNHVQYDEFIATLR